MRIMSRDGLTAMVAETSDPLLRTSRWFRTLPPENPPLGDLSLAEWLPTLRIERAVLMPCSDHRVSEVAALPGELRERFPASVPRPETLERFVDKGRFAEMLAAAGVPHPFSKPITDARDLADIPEMVFASAM